MNKASGIVSFLRTQCGVYNYHIIQHIKWQL